MPLQSRQGLSDAAPLRRPPGRTPPAAPVGADGRDLARVSAPARAAAAGDAILGILPGVVYEPTTAEEAAGVVRESARDGRSLAFIGGGTDLERGFPPERLDAVVRTGRLARVLEHAPSDQIVIVEAGMTLASLQETLAAHGQRLALDPPLPGRATAGGIVAGDAVGPRGVRFEGFRAGVAEQRQRLEALCRGEARGACEVFDETAARAFWARHDALRTENSLRGRVALLPARIETLAGEILPEILPSLDDPGFA